jgi:putative ABC transport system permease protein
LNEFDQTDQLTNQLKDAHPELLVESYKEVAPDLELFNNQIKVNIMIMTSIFMLALIFGIINTMLMAVLERIKELGMLMAIGMNKLKIFFMIMLETIFISVLGAPIGMGLGYVTIWYLHYSGINLSRWSRALEEFGMDDIIRPVLDPSVYGIVALSVIATALLAAIYPSLKAIRLKPVEALRKI